MHMGTPVAWIGDSFLSLVPKDPKDSKMSLNILKKTFLLILRMLFWFKILKSNFCHPRKDTNKVYLIDTNIPRDPKVSKLP